MRAYACKFVRVCGGHLPFQCAPKRCPTRRRARTPCCTPIGRALVVTHNARTHKHVQTTRTYDTRRHNTRKQHTKKTRNSQTHIAIDTDIPNRRPELRQNDQQRRANTKQLTDTKKTRNSQTQKHSQSTQYTKDKSRKKTRARIKELEGTN